MNANATKTVLKAVSTNGAPRQFAFYTVTFESGASEWTAHWGRIGTKGRERVYRERNGAAARFAAEDRFYSKIAKGYRKVDA